VKIDLTSGLTWSYLTGEADWVDDPMLTDQVLPDNSTRPISFDPPGSKTGAGAYIKLQVYTINLIESN
jgi:hypothetical protein